MSLEELMQTILNSSMQDWYRIGFGYGGGEAPSYIHSHDTIAVYKPDPSIVIAFGATEKKILRLKWLENVYNHKLDGPTSSHYADVLFNGVLVYRDIYACVAEEGLGLLPIPRLQYVSEGYSIPEGYRRFVQLLHWIAMPSTRDFDYLFNMTRFNVDTEVEWPEL